MSVEIDLIDKFIEIAKKHDILVYKNRNNQITLSFSEFLIKILIKPQIF